MLKHWGNVANVCQSATGGTSALVVVVVCTRVCGQSFDAVMFVVEEAIRMRAEADEDDESESWGFSFTETDGRRNDGRASLRIGEEVRDLGGMMGVSDGKMVTWAGRRWT